MCTSSISSSSPSAVRPNSYFVSARISPAAAATSWPRRNSSSATVDDLLPERRLDEPALDDLGHRQRFVVDRRPGGGFVVGVTIGSGRAVFLRSPSGKW